MSTYLKKYPLVFFFKKEVAFFFTIASIFWQIRLQTRLISDSQSYKVWHAISAKLSDITKCDKLLVQSFQVLQSVAGY